MTSEAGSKKSFRRLEKRAIANEIVDQISAMIRSGALRPGDRLPSELALMELLGVGRSSVREALKALEILGVLARTNSGTVVSEAFPLGSLSQFLSAELIAKRLEVAEVYEARRILEIELAALALRTVSSDEVETLRSLCSRMEQLGVGEIERYAEVDREFHRVICSLSGNQILTSMWEIAYDFFLEIRLSVPVSPEFLTLSNARHRMLVGALEAGDVGVLRSIVSSSLELGELDLTREIGD